MTKNIFKMVLFFILTVAPNLYSDKIVILVCGVGALIMYVLSENQNKKVNINSDKNIQDIKNAKNTIPELNSEIEKNKLRALFMEIKHQDGYMILKCSNWLQKFKDVITEKEIEEINNETISFLENEKFAIDQEKEWHKKNGIEFDEKKWRSENNIRNVIQ